MKKRLYDSLKIGDSVQSQGIEYVITHITSLTSFLARELNSENVKHLKLSDLDNEQQKSDVNSLSVNSKDALAYSDEEWEIAQYRLSVIKPLLETPHRTDKDTRLAAERASVGVATVYNWMRAYQETEDLSSLIPHKRGAKSGTRLIASEQEQIVDAAIKELYLSTQKRKPSAVIEEVKLRCNTAGITPPHPNTVRNRIKSLPERQVVRARHGRDIARNMYQPIRGEFPGADFPLSVVQIDHTPADIIVVENDSRQPYGRPWITLAIDVFSRMVVGVAISMESPSAAIVGQCVSNAMLPKDEYLAKVDVPGDWPVWGRMQKIHVDNAKEFRGKMLKRSCQIYGIDLQLRPVKLPHYGGHIERLMGTSANDIRNLPGATLSNVPERKGYDSEGKATLTLEEFETRLIDFIINVYHKRCHSALNMSPLMKWEKGILGDNKKPGIGLPEVPTNKQKLLLDFMPFVERTIQPYGILNNHVYYYHESLNAWINSKDDKDPKRKKLFIVRYDPRDLSKVYFYDPEIEAYYEIPYRNMALPAINVWELREALKRLKEEGKKSIDENAIFDAIRRMRKRVEEAQLKTKHVRRQHKRRKTTERLASQPKTNKTQPPAPSDLIDDLFSTPIEPYDEVQVSESDYLTLSRTKER